MIGRIVSLTPSYFALLSGVFISIATTAMTGIAFSATRPENFWKLIGASVITSGAGFGWFLIAEEVPRLRAKIERNMVGLSSPNDQEARKSALNVVEKADGLRIKCLVLFTIICSIGWPWL